MSEPKRIHPFNEGYNARCEGLSECDNPYTEQGRDRAAWQHGWDDADEDLAEEDRANA
jgi:ribosome modulation factor